MLVGERGARRDMSIRTLLALRAIPVLALSLAACSCGATTGSAPTSYPAGAKPQYQGGSYEAADKSVEPLSTQGVVGDLIMGVGALSMTAGLTMGIVALAKKSSLEESCRHRDTCPLSRSGDLDSYRTWADGATFGLFAGAILISAGSIVRVTAPVRRKTAGVELLPYAGSGSAGLAGRF
jgi:hypothetical protein